MFPKFGDLGMSGIIEVRDYSSASPHFDLALTASMMAKILDGRAKDVLKRRTVELALTRR